jgi:hypothetical protein
MGERTNQNGSNEPEEARNRCQPIVRDRASNQRRKTTDGNDTEYAHFHN